MNTVFPSAAQRPCCSHCLKPRPSLAHISFQPCCIKTHTASLPATATATHTWINGWGD